MKLVVEVRRRGWTFERFVIVFCFVFVSGVFFNEKNNCYLCTINSVQFCFVYSFKITKYNTHELKKKTIHVLTYLLRWLLPRYTSQYIYMYHHSVLKFCFIYFLRMWCLIYMYSERSICVCSRTCAILFISKNILHRQLVQCNSQIYTM